MRRLPVLTLASLVAVLGMVAAPVYSATLFGTDTPDIRLGVGEKAESVFDLDDFFDSATSATIGYKQNGTALTGSVVSIFGSSTAGKSSVKFAATAGSETLEKESVVQVSSFRIANVPAIDNNNRLAGVAGGNAFLNGIVSGGTVNSAEKLTLVGGKDFGSLTGAAVTGSAALIATIGEVGVTYADTGLVVRSCAVKAEGAGKATFGGLTAELLKDGSYSLKADSTFAGPFVVTLGAQGGASADAVHVLAAKATNMAVDAAAWQLVPAGGGSYPQATVSIASNQAVVTAKKGQAILVVAKTGVKTTEYATISMNFTASTAGANVAVIGFDADGLGTLDGNKISYDLLAGSVIEAGKAKNAAVTMKTKSGSVLPAFQVYNSGDADLTVTISSIQVINARPLVDFALNPNAEAALAIAGDLKTIAGVNPVGDAVGGTADAGNHFASPNGAGSLKLTGAAKPANVLIPATGVDDGSFQTECWVKKVSSTAGIFYLYTTDGVKGSQTSVSTDQLGADWEKVINTGVAKAGGQFVVVQAVNSSVLVDDISLRILEDSDKFFDYALLGL